MNKELSGAQKAAILLRAIGEEAAAQVMKTLDPKDIRKLGLFMKETANITKQEEDSVIAEFEQASASGEVQFEGREFMEAILKKALGPEKAARMIESLNTKTYPGIDALKWVDSRTVAQILKIEHPQTIAVCLAQMEAEQASAVLALLPTHLHADVSLRLATMQEVQPEVLSELSDSLQEILSASMGMSSMSVGGAELMADILTRVDKNTEGAIMAKITEKDQALADSIRALMFVFDDLVGLDSRAMQELMKEISKEDLPIALRGATPEIKEKFLKNMSSRAAEMLKEDMETRGPVKVSDVEKSQQNILKVCRKLEEEGRIVIGGGGSEEML
ncbi:MAG: flagellar motor switch protein FliG [Nitrospira sp. CR2.1]|nr:flagellar motor switch protein FliG [Nitrospira sp. CR2.1]MBA5873483.1 flagellar motor switch protein FliG [Nitrospira sp. CR1.2]